MTNRCRCIQTLACLSIVVLAACATRPALAQTAAGIGTRPCSAFRVAVEEQTNAALDAYVSWTQGFISGFNWADVRQRDLRVEPVDIINWLGSFCAANPDRRIYDAIQQLIQLEAR